jgi:Domain of unknown function (DUF4168)
MGLLIRSLSAAILIAAWHSSYVAVANAQGAQREAPSPGLATPAPRITEQKLDAAAAALERVASLKKTYEQRLTEAPARAEKERIVAEANDALEKAIADQGLSVEEYSSILEVAENDPEVRGKILQRIRPSQDDRN